MKNSLILLKSCLLACLLCGNPNTAGASLIAIGASNTFAPDDPGAPISRTYLNGLGNTNTGESIDGNWRHRWRQKPEQAGGQKMVTDVIISYQDFQNHLALGQNRIVRRVTPNNDGTFSMDVGAEGLATGEVWTLPNLSPGAYPEGQTQNYNSVAVTSTPNFEFFTSEDVETGEITNPAAAYDLNGELYQYLDFFVSEFDGEVSGTLDNLGYDRNGNIYGFYATVAPVPLSLASFNLEVFVEDTPCDFFLTGGCESGNPNEATFDLQQDFEVLASGTLNTYDGESSQGIKLRNTDIITIKDDNGQVIETRTSRYVLWYTKAGHFVKAGLAEGAPWTGMTTIRNFEYQKLASPALPVEWLDISTEVIDAKAVKVNWSTATETQSESFVVESSVDGQTFAPLGTLAAAGESDQRRDYTYTDTDPQQGFNYYRIQQRDFDGSSSYSSIVSALITTTANDEEVVVLYPNPGRNEVYFSQPVNYELLTVSGQLLAAGRAEAQLDVSALPAGTYLVRIDGGEVFQWIKR